MCPNSDDTKTKAQNSWKGTTVGLIVHPILMLCLSITVYTETIEIMTEIWQ